MVDKKLTEDEVTKYFAWLDMAKAKRKNDFEPNLKYWDLYSGKRSTTREITTRDDVNINMVYPNVEAQKWAVFIRNPKIFITAKKKTMRAKKRVMGVNVPITIDVTRNAYITQAVINQVIDDIEVSEQVEKIRDDALVPGYGVGMLGYKTDIGIDDGDNEFIKNETLWFRRIPMFLVDPEATDMELFTDAAWVARPVFMRREDVLAMYDIEKDELTSNLVGYGSSIRDKDMGDGKYTYTTLLEKAGGSYKESEDAKRELLYEMWKPPSIVEKEKDKNAKGKVIVLLDGYPKPLRKRGDKDDYKDWPYDMMEGYPFLGLQFNTVNDEQYGPSDIKIYEDQIDEKVNHRSLIKNYMQKTINPKVIVNTEYVNEELAAKITDPEINLIKHNFEGLDDLRKAVMVFQMPSLPATAFQYDQMIDRDRDEQSGVSELRRGQEAPRRKTATQSTLEFQAGSGKFNRRLFRVAVFYKRLARKMIQLMREFYTAKQYIQVMGVDEKTGLPSMQEIEFNKEDVKGEFDIRVDVSTMSDVNEAVQRQQATQWLSMASNAVMNDKFRLILANEGREISISEAIDEYEKVFNIENKDIVKRIGPERQAQVVAEIQALMQLSTPQPPGQGAAGAGGTPTTASVSAQAQQPPRPPAAAGGMP